MLQSAIIDRGDSSRQCTIGTMATGRPRRMTAGDFAELLADSESDLSALDEESDQLTDNSDRVDQDQ